jgi:hypothetical protein
MKISSLWGGKSIMSEIAEKYAARIYGAAIPVLRILGLASPQWARNVDDERRGPWLQAKYEVLNDTAWREKCACLYMVAGIDGGIRYFGISRNGVKHRWRTSPAFDPQTMRPLGVKQLFHSQCWKHMQAESSKARQATYEVRVIQAAQLVPLLERMGPPLSGFTVLKDDGESVVASVERWFCNHRTQSLARWNSAMTSR